MKHITRPILLISSGLFHPSLPARFSLRRFLQERCEAGLQSIASLEELPGLAVERFGALVLYIHQKAVSPRALDCLDAYLRQGGGLMALHSASASFKSEARYHDLLGGRFTGHGAVQSFEVEPVKGGEHVFPSTQGFSLRDERYLHEIRGGVQVHFVSVVGDERNPFAWTRRHGEGRVCYCAAGHTVASLRHPAVRGLIEEGLAWVSGGRA